MARRHHGDECDSNNTLQIAANSLDEWWVHGRSILCSEDFPREVCQINNRYLVKLDLSARYRRCRPPVTRFEPYARRVSTQH
jgi:hypothetical protein